MNKNKIAIIGLGYVGLPLARLFATKYPVVGFDINKKRVEELISGKDNTLEVEESILKSVLASCHCGLDPQSSNKNGLFCSYNLDDIKIATTILLPFQLPLIRITAPI